MLNIKVHLIEHQINIWAPHSIINMLHSFFLTVGALQVMAEAPRAAPLLTTVRVETRSRAAVQTAVLQLPSALDLDSQESAGNHSLKANHNLLFSEWVHKHT